MDRKSLSFQNKQWELNLPCIEQNISWGGKKIVEGNKHCPSGFIWRSAIQAHQNRQYDNIIFTFTYFLILKPPSDAYQHTLLSTQSIPLKKPLQEKQMYGSTSKRHNNSVLLNIQRSILPESCGLLGFRPASVDPK